MQGVKYQGMVLKEDGKCDSEIRTSIGLAKRGIPKAKQRADKREKIIRKN